MLKHVIHATSLSPERLKRVFNRAESMGSGKYQAMLPKKYVAILFYEPSLRTFFSFDRAAKALGADTLTTADAKNFSSHAKGESYEDTIHVLSGYCDCIVLRHWEAGLPARVAQPGIARVPVINAGDGNNEHPTQAYLDLFTILQAQKQGRLPKRPLNLLFWGDNENSRTVRSLAKLIVSHGPALGVHVERIAFFGPNGFGVPPGDVTGAIVGKCELDLHTTIPSLADTDIVYVTRPQFERHGKGRKIEVIPFTQKLANKLPMDAIIMHPLPRNDELPIAYDDHRAWFIKQSDGGVALRTALLWHVLQG